MRKLLFVFALALAFAPLAAQAQDRTFQFAGVPWGASPEEAKRILVDRGYTFEKVDDDGDYKFTGNLVGQDAVIYATLSRKNRVEKIQVILITPDEEARSVFKEMRATLTTKYGKPTGCLEQFSAPYRDGDGREVEAFRAEKATFLCLWKPDKGGVGLEITKALAVRIIYESPAWSEESAARKAQQSARDF